MKNATIALSSVALPPKLAFKQSSQFFFSIKSSHISHSSKLKMDTATAAK